MLANEARLLVAWGLDPAHEAAVVPNRLDQATGLGTVKTALFDADYHTDGVMTATTERGIELLCPSGRTLPDGDRTRPADKPYSKSQFTYDAAHDTYRCPAGAQLMAGERCHGKTPAEGYTRYRTRACAACAQCPPCTTSKHGRTLKRYRCDDAKAALRQAMAEPANRNRYRQRQAMVESVFRVLRRQQGLNRFRRRGLPAVRCEFARHVMAYNLGRALALRPAGTYGPPLWFWIQRFRRWLRQQLACAGLEATLNRPHLPALPWSPGWP